MSSCLNPSDTVDVSVQIFAHQVTGTDNSNFQKKVGKLHELVCNKTDEDCVLVLCNYSSVRRAALFLREKTIRACLFTNDMLDEGPALVESEKEKFDQLRFGICSYDIFEKSQFPVVDSYIIFELPSKISRLPKLLNQLEKSAQSENCIARIDVIVSLSDNADFIEALHMEMVERKCAIPYWLSKSIILKYASLNDQPKLLEEERRKCEKTSTGLPKKDTTESQASSFSIPTQSAAAVPVLPVTDTTPRKTYQEEYVDIHNIRPNNEGKYVVPARMVAFADEGEYDDDDYYSSEEENEVDYNYDEYCF